MVSLDLSEPNIRGNSVILDISYRVSSKINRLFSGVIFEKTFLEMLQKAKSICINSQNAYLFDSKSYAFVIIERNFEKYSETLVNKTPSCSTLLTEQNRPNLFLEKLMMSSYFFRPFVATPLRFSRHS